MSDICFYNSDGRPVAYTEDGEHIYLFNGTPSAYIYGDSVYAFSGKHLGRFNNGWIRDNYGNCAFFTPQASGTGPLKPLKELLPLKGLKELKPLKSLRELVPLKPLGSLNWSTLSSKNFFYQ